MKRSKVLRAVRVRAFGSGFSRRAFRGYQRGDFKRGECGIFGGGIPAGDFLSCAGKGGTLSARRARGWQAFFSAHVAPRAGIVDFTDIVVIARACAFVPGFSNMRPAPAHRKKTRCILRASAAPKSFLVLGFKKHRAFRRGPSVAVRARTVYNISIASPYE